MTMFIYLVTFVNSRHVKLDFDDIQISKRMYNPSVLLYILGLHPRLYRTAEEWYNLNYHG